MKKWLWAVGVLMIIGAIGYTATCPCGPVPGAWLFGERVEAPVSDWSFVNDRSLVPLCQLQVTTWRAHSINLNCMSTGGRLFVSCSNCASKSWSNDALSHPRGMLRAAGKLYPVTLQRLQEAHMLDAAWSARLAKIKGEAAPRPAHWWSFELVSRS